MAQFYYLIFALLPSIIWLLYFLRKDVHPEPKGMILKIFSLGMLMALPAIVFELSALRITEEIFAIINLNDFRLISMILYIFLGVAFIEEYLKYLIVKFIVLNNPEFDEPLDVMLYMVIAALGFAASENILILFNLAKFSPQPEEIFTLSIFRFVGATFLHALCSAALGYFLALSLFASQNKMKLTILGLAMAIVLHGLYNFSIMIVRGWNQFIIPFMILVGLLVFVSMGFNELKKLKSVCKIK